MSALFFKQPFHLKTNLMESLMEFLSNYSSENNLLQRLSYDVEINIGYLG